jgi:hypothetical protein
VDPQVEPVPKRRIVAREHVAELIVSQRSVGGDRVERVVLARDEHGFDVIGEHHVDVARGDGAGNGEVVLDDDDGRVFDVLADEGLVRSARVDPNLDSGTIDGGQIRKALAVDPANERALAEGKVGVAQPDDSLALESA